MAMLCKVCGNENRVLIDKMVAKGGVSIREIAKRFDISAASLFRHAENHILKHVQKTALRRESEHIETVGEIWKTRLDDTYQRTVRGSDAAPDDPRWMAPMAKVVETGLRASGIISGGTEVTVNAASGSMVVLPYMRPELPAPAPAPAHQALPAPADDADILDGDPDD